MSNLRNKSTKYPKLFITIVSVVFILLCLSLFFLWRPPKTAAQVYLETVGEDFSSVQKVLVDYAGDVEDLSEAMAAFLKNFYGQTNRLKYDEALKKTQDDIEKSQALILAIQQARQTKESLPLPVGFERVSTLLDEYYRDAETLVESYQKKREFQLVLMNAYGPELSTQVTQAGETFNKLLNITPSDQEIPSGPREVSMDYQSLKDLQANYQQIASLSSQSFAKMQELTDVPEEEQLFYQSKMEELKLLNDYAEQSLRYLNQETIPGVQSYIALSFDFSKSIQVREDELFENIKSQITSIQTVNNIQRISEIESELNTELAKLSAENRVKLEISPVPSPSTGPSPSLDPTIELSPSPIIILTPEASETPVPQDTATPAATVSPVFYPQ